MSKMQRYEHVEPGMEVKIALFEKLEIKAVISVFQSSPAPLCRRQ